MRKRKMKSRNPQKRKFFQTDGCFVFGEASLGAVFGDSGAVLLFMFTKMSW